MENFKLKKPKQKKCIYNYNNFFIIFMSELSSTDGSNRPSSLVPLFQNESKCKTIQMKTSLICMKMNL